MSPLTVDALIKMCATCGRQISWRKKWEKNWASVTYCSDSCRKHKVRPKPHSLDLSFESKILSLLSERRAVQGPAAVVTCEEAEEETLQERKWRVAEDHNHTGPAGDSRNSLDHVPGHVQAQAHAQPPSKTRERCRQAARRLAARGDIVITQNGKVVEPSFAKGVMELKFP
ncbi:uncharacterized protein L3040_005595 [Drepanopeziza brunnea f. sp. 'multigermtubi']|uniref:DUF2256 and DUF3253 domain-containing protein n=1 Tax=Marssonina brunnea f. sp. multigermtubi (strain MB_m1) TaxID=1072389 RepID=K1WYT1_MARBU|nr:uncharacterized protein MBM_07989 [Drepanopeziza brunnea f. sp. 'multigermtubi' MB_m1]EKD13788.1 hypothetical protein MBM_07989 [Drepanopeziza brunnea f. sp. 'multigermtubi' MB_m1]KAJ5041038.1 hypothetical protein L3040_005595 [Drepanopeziza brunnea f. sp. 'multigermtubi']